MVTPSRLSTGLFEGVGKGGHIVRPQGDGEPTHSEKVQVVYISSYHSTYVWSVDMEKGLKEELSQFKDKPLELYTEYLDGKRFPEQDYIDALAEVFAIKYRSIRVDALVVSDDDAVNFALTQRDQLFPTECQPYAGAAHTLCSSDVVRHAPGGLLWETRRTGLRTPE